MARVYRNIQYELSLQEQNIKMCHGQTKCCYGADQKIVSNERHILISPLSVIQMAISMPLFSSFRIDLPFFLFFSIWFCKSGGGSPILVAAVRAGAVVEAVVGQIVDAGPDDAAEGGAAAADIAANGVSWGGGGGGGVEGGLKCCERIE